ncbi:hypothetical protein ABIF90_007861 [Bradyrhizobium japonicum]
MIAEAEIGPRVLKIGPGQEEDGEKRIICGKDARRPLDPEGDDFRRGPGRGRPDLASLPVELADDQEAAQDEEYPDADAARVELQSALVIEIDQDDRETAQPVEAQDAARLLGVDALRSR